MRPFYQTRTYYSDYSVQELTDILRAGPIGKGALFAHKLDKEKNGRFILKPFADEGGVRNSFVPVVEIQLQEENGKAKVILTCRLIRFCEIFAYIYCGCILAITIGLLITYRAQLNAVNFLPVIIIGAFATVFFGVGTCATFAWYRKKFIRELKLTPVDKNSKGENEYAEIH